MNSNQRDARRAEAERLIREGGSDRGIARELCMDKGTVARIRRSIGVAPIPSATHPSSRIPELLTGPDADGHTGWTGPVTHGGLAHIRHEGRLTPVAHLIYAARVGRKPVGTVKANCGIRTCLTPRHLADEVERRNERLGDRGLVGLPAPWTVCGTCGADWDTAGRITEARRDTEGYITGGLKLYCLRCDTARARRNRNPRKDENA